MPDFTFYTVAMSRGQIARWALHEAGADYEHVVFDWDSRPAKLSEINPMNKVPTLVHHHRGHDHVVSEAAAICHYLAETCPDAGLLPDDHEKADYFRWLFFAAGPLEQAIVAKSMEWEVPEGKSGMAGFGSFEMTMDNIDQLLSGRDFVCGNRFTMADVYFGSQVDWGLMFGSIPARPSFEAYASRLRSREKYAEAKTVDQKLMEAAQGS